MLNKKEVEQVSEFLSLITDFARSMLDEVAEFEAVLKENKNQQRQESEKRLRRKRTAKARRRSL